MKGENLEEVFLRSPLLKRRGSVLIKDDASCCNKLSTRNLLENGLMQQKLYFFLSWRAYSASRRHSKDPEGYKLFHHQHVVLLPGLSGRSLPVSKWRKTKKYCHLGSIVNQARAGICQSLPFISNNRTQSRDPYLNRG